jgi:hypothetical protein
MAAARPKVASESQKELDRVEEQFKEFDNQVQEMTMDRMSAAPKHEHEPQTKLSSSEIEKSKEIYLKPFKTIGVADKFNEKFREKWNYDKEYVQFIAENKEIIGETIELFTRPYGGVPAELWKVPVNKPVWGPRYLAEQIKRKCYHRLVMQDNGVRGHGEMYGQMTVDTTIQRLDAHPVNTRKSIFMGASK